MKDAFASSFLNLFAPFFKYWLQWLIVSMHTTCFSKYITMPMIGVLIMRIEGYVAPQHCKYKKMFRNHLSEMHATFCLCLKKIMQNLRFSII